MTPGEKLAKLIKYAENLKSRLSDTTIPAKHVKRPQAYKEFLERDLKKTTIKIDALKLTTEGKK